MGPTKQDQCVFEATRMVSVSESHNPIRDPKLVHDKDQYHQKPTTDPDHKLHFCLSKRILDSGSKPELNLIESFHIHSTALPQGNEVEQRVHSCNFCPRKFNNPQALGGHQNAHKRKQTLAMRGQQLGPALRRHSTKAALPFQGSSNLGLGIQPHSMISKPPILESSHICRTRSWMSWPKKGHYGGARSEWLHKFSPGSNGGDGGGEECRWDSLGGNNHMKANQEESQKEDSHKLDLSLKL